MMVRLVGGEIEQKAACEWRNDCTFFFPVDMVKAMKEVAQTGKAELTVEQRNLLSVAYKNVIGARRASWRIISSIEQKALERQDASAEKKERNADYRKSIEKELKDICGEVLALLDEHLIPKAEADESKVFYYKM